MFFFKVVIRMGEKQTAGATRTHPNYVGARLVRLGAFRLASVPARSGIRSSGGSTSKKRRSSAKKKAASTTGVKKGASAANAARLRNLKKAQKALRAKRKAAKKSEDG